MPLSMVDVLRGASTEGYRAVTGWALGAPEWVRGAAEAGTDLLLAGFAAVMLAVWWRSRRWGARAVGAALLGPVAAVAAYLVSETAKSVVEQDRPCRAVWDAAASIAACPEVGDWSFPSNHAAVAGAAAAAAVVAWRWAGAVVVPLAVLEAFSRVFVGVHYPHDVLVGLAVGAVVAVPVVVWGSGPAGVLVERLRGVGGLRWLLAADAPRERGRAVVGGGSR
ncbi:phosphatase PAP2 family protein [Nocardiopsis sp. CNT-189]